MTLKERFDSKWTPEPYSGCWLWIGPTRGRGYGAMSKGYAHRTSWMMFRGEIPKNMCVLHRCDTPRCVNPDHLFLGTQLQNVSDCISKGRFIKGEDHKHAKLTASQVREIKNSCECQRRLAERYGVGYKCISKIKRGTRWRHIEKSE